MGVQLQFPRNFDRYVEMGQNALDSGNSETAISCFEKAYALEQSFSLSLLLVTALMEAGRYSEAKNYAEEFQNEYFDYPEFFTIYISILIHTKEFVAASKLVNGKILEANESEVKRWILLKKQIYRAETKHKKLEFQEVDEIKAHMKALGQLSFTEQVLQLKEADSLPQEDFISVSKSLLMDSNVHGLVRSSLLEELAQLKIEDKVNYVGFDEKNREIRPAEIGAITDCGSYQRLIMFLENETLHTDPVLHHTLVEEVRLHFALLYPFADEVVKDPKLWAMSYLQKYSSSYSDSIESSQEMTEIQNVQNRMREIIDRLSM